VTQKWPTKNFQVKLATSKAAKISTKTLTKRSKVVKETEPPWTSVSSSNNKISHIGTIGQLHVVYESAGPWCSGIWRIIRVD